MKKLILAACVSALMASPAMAHKKMDVDPSDKAEYLQKTLQLNDQQTQSVVRILKEAHQQKKSLAEKYRISQYEQYKEEKKDLMSKTHDRISEVLSEPQRDALEAHMDFMKKLHKKDD